MVRSPLTIISGPAGTGKSTTLRALVAAVLMAGKSVALLASTWSAASRMADMTGQPALTVHTFLGRAEARGSSCPDVLLVDEAAMLDSDVAARLFGLARGVKRLVLIGDAHQLPPVGPGHVFADIEQSGTAPVTVLSEIYRQGHRGTLVSAANEILRGAKPPLQMLPASIFSLDRDLPIREGAWFCEVDDARLPEVVTKVAGRLPEAQCMAPLRRGPTGVTALGALVAAARHGGDSAIQGAEGAGIRLGERVVVVDRDRLLGVAKGEAGVLRGVAGGMATVEFNGVERVVAVDLAAEALLAASCITIHRAQSTEFESVIVAVPAAAGGFLSREMLYTAITRARSRVVVVGARKTLYAALGRQDGARRVTGLGQRLLSASMRAAA
ncbi:MAG: ATP-dependent DNA helicase [Chloroflexota bacterium]